MAIATFRKNHMGHSIYQLSDAFGSKIHPSQNTKKARSLACFVWLSWLRSIQSLALKHHQQHQQHQQKHQLRVSKQTADSR